MTIKSILRAAVFTGAIAALPVAALADTGRASGGGDEATAGVPDHAAAEARSTGDAIGTSGDRPFDHAAAEARSTGDGTSSFETGAGVPDHATAEARGAADQTVE